MNAKYVGLFRSDAFRQSIDFPSKRDPESLEVIKKKNYTFQLF